MIISIVHFNSAFYILDGTLKLHPDASFDNCPPGRLLYPTGTEIDNMVSVYDPASGLAGYVNPNSFHFIIGKDTEEIANETTETETTETTETAVTETTETEATETEANVNNQIEEPVSEEKPIDNAENKYKNLANFFFTCSFCCFVITIT